MKQLISEHHIEICFQLRDFLRTNHKFSNLVSINTKFFITDVTDRYLFSVISRFIRTRNKFLKKNRWSDSWVINRFEFRKTIVSLKKIFNLSSSFAFRHSREFSKNTTISFEFVNLRLHLSKKLSFLISSFDLVDQILLARQQLTQDRLISISSSLTSISFTSQSSNIFIENSDSTISIESFNMFDFETELNNQSRFNIASFFDVISASIFFTAQRTEIADINAIAIKAIQMQQFISSLTSTTQSTSSYSQSAEYIKKWTVDEIEFFDSNIDDDESIVNVSRHVFYKNIYVFVDRLKDMIVIREDDKLRIVLSQCFRGAALIWHFIELYDMKKDLLRQINLASWYQIMINRFKKRTSLVLFALQNFKYDLIDAKFEKDLRLFAQQIFRSIKTVNMNSIHNQLTIAWNNLDWRFRANIFESTITTFIRKFLNQLNFMSDIWQEMIRSQDQFKFIRNRFQNSRRTHNYSEYFVRSNSLLFSYQYQDAYSNYQLDNRQYERFEYRNRNIRSYNSRDNRFVDSRYFKKKSSEFASVLSFTRQSLQIIEKNANQSASDSSYLEIKSKNNRDYKRKNRAYVTKKDEHENEMNNSLDDEYYHESNSELNYYNFEQNQKKKSKVNFSTSAQIFTCKKCKRVFLSNNRLHEHLRQDLCEQVKFKAHVDTTNHKILNESTINFVMNILIVESSVDSFKDVDTDFEFREWIYVKMMINLFIKNYEAQICLDTNCSVILADRNFIKIHAAHYIIRRMITLLNVRDLKINKHETFEYIIASIYFAGKIAQRKLIREVIRRKMHLMNDVKVNMLIENDILSFEDIFIDDVNSKVTIASCQHMIISIEIRTLTKEMINKVLHARFITIISSYSMIIISIHRSNLSFIWDFWFESADLNMSLYAHTMNDFIKCIMIKNAFNKSINIFRNTRLSTIIEIQYSNGFHAESDTSIQNLVEQKSRRIHRVSWFIRVFKTTTTAYIAATTIIISNSNIDHSNDVTIHNSNLIVIFIFKIIIDDYFNLWKSEKFVKLSKNQWMRISLKFDWEIRIFEKIKIYSLRTENKKLVDQIFDDLHAKKRLKYTIESTSFSYSVFVIWKMINDQKKNQIVIDIRDLNAIILFDAYSLSLQSDVISAIKKCKYLSIIECASFFYQWRIHSSNRHKLTIISYRDQKIFQIAIMKYKNNSSYVQKQIDKLFANYSSQKRLSMISSYSLKHWRNTSHILEKYSKFWSKTKFSSISRKSSSNTSQCSC